MKKKILFVCVLSLLLLLWGGVGIVLIQFCTPDHLTCGYSLPKRVLSDFNGIYYWRTSFNSTQSERDFLKRHDINRLYLRLFDVDMAQQNLLSEEIPTPIATLVFPDSAITIKTISMVEDIVPVCYITIRALKAMQDNEEEYAKKIVERMLNMCSYHGFRDKVTEIQIDCDWTQSTEQSYFRLLSKIKNLLGSQDIALSATIRLHQLRMEPPKMIDRGVLMIYNTGSIKNPKTQNSILSYQDAAQYLSHSEIEKYPIPLDYALPAFAWGVWFRNGHYMGILHRSRYDNPHYYEAVDSTHYRVLHEHIVEERTLQEGDIIRLEKSDIETIMQIKQLLPFNENKPSIILYHLDANKLNDYENSEINSIYSRPMVH